MIIKKLSSGCAPGIDDISSEQLKTTANSVASRLLDLCRFIWQEEKSQLSGRRDLFFPSTKIKAIVAAPPITANNTVICTVKDRYSHCPTSYSTFTSGETLSSTSWLYIKALNRGLDLDSSGPGPAT